MNSQTMCKSITLIILGLLSACVGRQGPPAPYTQHQGAQPQNAAIVVQKGDSVSKIALRYKASIQEIITINRLKPPYKLQVGQRLIIPGIIGTVASKNPFDITLPALASKPKTTINVEKLTDDSGISSLDPAEDSSLAPDISPGTVPKASLKLDIKPDISIPASASVPEPAPEADLIEDPTMPIPDIPLKDSLKKDSLAVKTDDKKASSETSKKDEPRKDVAVDKDQDKKIKESLTAESKKEDAAKAPLAFKWPTHGDIVRKFKKGKNDGINIAAPEGSSVVAAEDGTVVYVGDKLPGFGNLIMVKHRNGWMTAYAHTKDVSVKRDMVLKKGQEIAKVGQSGNVNSPQLHFEVRKRTQAVDPEPLLE